MVNDFLVCATENSRDKRKFWKGSPIFPIGTFRMEIRLPFTSFLSFVLQSTPDNPNLQGKSKKVRVIGSSKKIAGSKEKKQFLLHSEHFNHI